MIELITVISAIVVVKYLVLAGRWVFLTLLIPTEVICHYLGVEGPIAGTRRVAHSWVVTICGWVRVLGY